MRERLFKATSNRQRLMVSMAVLFAVFLLAGQIITMLARSSNAHGAGPVADPALETRLTTKRTYRARPGDTWVRAAHLLYGHRTWWSKLKKLNPHLDAYGPDDEIPRGTKIIYRAPEIGGSYIVRKNDWLIRIAEWKYGSSERWVALYRKNADRIRDPNLIHPGDRLTLESNGEVKNQDTGKVILSGIEKHEEEAARMLQDQVDALPTLDDGPTGEELASPDYEPTAVDDPAGADSRPSVWNPGPEGTSDPADLREPANEGFVPFWSPESAYFYFFLGFLFGCALLFTGLLKWVYDRHLAHAVASGKAPAPRRPKLRPSEGPCESKACGKPTRETFGHGPVKTPYVDRTYMGEEHGEVDRTPSYHSIVPKTRWKNYLKSKKNRGKS